MTNTDLQPTDLGDADVNRSGLVYDAKHGHNVPVFRLGDEFGKNSNVIHGALGVGHPHGPYEPVNLPLLPRVVVG